MNRHLYLVALFLTGCVAANARAGIIFKRATPPSPEQRVPELISILQTDPNDTKRVAAADELKQFDPKKFPEIVGVLLERLQKDTKPEVRVEAAASLAKFRPVSPEIGAALEQALANETTTKGRSQLRTTLRRYQSAGYKPAKTEGPNLNLPGPVKEEPPLAQPAPVQTQRPLPPRVVPVPVNAPTQVYKPLPSSQPTTTEPPLAPVEQGPSLTAPK